MLTKSSFEYFHHHAFEIVNTYSELKEKLSKSLKYKIDIDPRIKKKKQEEFVKI